MTYTITEFRKNHRKAFTEASQGKPILITRHDETFRLVLDGGNSSKASVGVKPETTSEVTPAMEVSDGLLGDDSSDHEDLRKVI